MAAVTEVNRIINQIEVEDNTAQGAATAVENIDRVVDAAERGQDAATGLGDAMGKGMQTVRESTTSGATTVVDATGRMVNAWRDGADTAVEGANRIDRAVEGVKKSTDALQDGLRLDGGIVGAETVTKELNTVKEGLSGTSEAAKSTASDVRDSVTGISESVQKAADAGSLAWDQMSQSVIRSFGRSGDAVSRQINKTLTEFGKLQSMQDTALSAVADGTLSQSDANRVIGNQTAKVDTTAASVGLARINAVTSPQEITQIVEAEGDASAASAKLSAAYEAQQTALKELRVQYEAGIVSATGFADTEHAIMARYVELEQAAQTAARAQNTNSTATQNATRLAKLEGYEIGILVDEAHKFIDMVVAGGSPLQALIYEGPNAVQVMGGVGAAISRVSSFMAGPGGLAVGATAAGLALYKMGAYAEQEEEQLAQLSQHLRATRADYTDMAATAEQAARSLSQNSDLSLSDSRTVTQTIVAVPTVDRTEIDRLTADARDLSAVMGVTVPDAAKTMAAALRDPASAAKQFADEGLQGFDAGLVLSVQHMQQMGDRSGVLSTVLSTLEASFKGAHDAALTPFQQSLEDLRKEAGPAGDAVVYMATHIGSAITGMATETVKDLTDLVALFKALPDELSSVASSVESAGGSVASWLHDKLETAVEAFTPAALARLMQQGNTADPTFSLPSNAASSSIPHPSNAESVKSAQVMIDQVAKEQSLSSDETSLLHLLQPAESATGQYKDGRLVTSSAGATGAMQVMPGNAAGYDLTDLHGNVSAGAKLLKSYYEKYDGDETLVAMAYNWGPGNVDKWLSKGADANAIPAETMNYVASTTEGRSYGQRATAVMDQQVDDVVGKGDTGTAGQLESYQRDLQSAQTAIANLNKEKQAGVLTDEQWSQKMAVAQHQLDASQAAIANTRDPLQQLAHDQDQAAASAAGLTEYQRQMISVAQQADQAQLNSNGQHATATEVQNAQARAQQTLNNQFLAGVDAISRQAAAQDRINAAYDGTGASIEQATNREQAYQDALAHYPEHSAAFQKAVASETEALNKKSEAVRQGQLQQQTAANNNQVSVLQVETATIGQNADARAKLINRMQAEQSEIQKGNSLQEESVQAYLASVDAVSDATAAYQHQEQTLSDLTGSLENMTEQLTDGVTQGFLQGTSSGMSFKSAMQGVETQVVSMLAKFALINPMLNSIDGQSRTTMSDITGMLSGSVSKDAGALSGGVADQTAESAFTLAKGIDGSDISVGQALNYKNALSSPTANTESLEGLESFGGGTYGAGLNGSAGGSSLLSGFLSTKLLGSSTVGSALGGIGGGLAIGGLTSQIGGGTYGMLGSGLGSAVGALAGSFIPGVGTLVGGLAGGGLGGLIGGLFSKSHYAYSDLVGTGGQLGIGGTRVKHADNDVTAGLRSDIDAINTVLGQTGVTVADDSTIGAVGHYHKGSKRSSTSIEDLLPDVHLSSSDANMKLALQQLMPSSFDSVSSYTSDIQSLKSLSDTLDAMGVAVGKFDDSSHLTVDHFTGYTGDMATALSTLDGKDLSTSDLESKFDAIKTFVGTTMPGLLDVTVSGSQSLMDQVAALKQKYQDAASVAESYGLDAQALLDKGNELAARTIERENLSLSQADQSVNARDLAATGDQEGADLANFDVSAAQQVQQLQDNWEGFLGGSYASNQDYAVQMADLEKTLADERLEIQKTYADKAKAADAEYQSQAQSSVASVFSSLSSYVQGLGVSDASPLSVQDQYKLANDNFNTDYQAAVGGDYNALSRLQSESQTALSLDKQWLGSGVDYSNAYQDQLKQLQSLGNLGTDTFTSNLAKQLAAQQVDATQKVQQAVQDMQAAITAELKQFIRSQSVSSKRAA
ncbi:transglycosylase SLT domain-containing protein [Acetobacter malorum]|uniref:transglycosylase SLT domain-containing protein n=1 Tax=Acetobacter malorum TaxID=178901 RepID=UPI00248D5964|nr:transglycosylase SLT domain-containing protein [Acetobacter malorum]